MVIEKTSLPLDSKNPIYRKRVLFFALSFFIICLWFCSWSLIDFFMPEENSRGVFGDKFGAINSLFSGLAFATLIYTLFLQMEELKLQRNELQLTREEVRGQKAEFIEQNITLRQQRFENTFFNMLSIHGDILESLSLIQVTATSNGAEEKILRGVDFIKCVLGNVSERIKKYKAVDQLESLGGARGVIIQELNKYISLLSYHNYFTTLFDFIDGSKFENCQFYYDVVISKLSFSEKEMLLFLGLTKRGTILKQRIEKYSLLKGVEFLQEPEVLSLYNASAFNKN